ncbi:MULTISPECIES: ScbA/BarX family gamma-butyrolactone biosynthesis protein [Kitasatospora]|uniref:Putative gamma-butyrolactone biosynthesis enzyme n=1 Tax=Kitasatospora setae (strain ATCC 33774 / DSM 43861 / JCM 3304 / KCC A-0304 / NBRC 14216 / KM-6054) TaxID=452652 RepID=E4NFG3_KITSK|nr:MULTISPECIES: ScbA/BarX family gamma-butyrolactone biosynthesis protein [Kitasatospora]BAJ30243.1 putative gamma-butyrolactone biosynthesis enzyme [Kitasatospora setae KM-6054]
MTDLLDTVRTGLTTIVPRQYVHRASVSEVLLTDWRAAPEPDAFVVRAQWPRGHALFAQSGGYQDPLLLMESVRQAGMLLAHAEYGVQLGTRFLLQSIRFSAAAELLVATPAPTEVELRVVAHGITRRGFRVTGMRFEMTVLVDGVPLATAGAAVAFTTPAVYARLRGDLPTWIPRPAGPAVDPATVGRRQPENVVLGAHPEGGPGRWRLRVDCEHPIFFDHPVDHVPGMLLIEGARQAAHAVTGRPDGLVVDLDSSFHSYAELDEFCGIEAERTGVDLAGDAHVHVRGVQDGRTVFTTRLTLRDRTR